MKRFFQILAFTLIFISQQIIAQNFTIDKIEPPNWWIGMKWDTLQLMVYGENLKDIDVKSSSDFVEVLSVHQSENDKYIFVDLHIKPSSEEGTYKLLFDQNDKVIEWGYPIHDREFAAEEHRGFTTEDVVYLIFTDRFNNGDPTNDTLAISRDEFKFRELNGRHGGDLQGVIDKLDYIKETGFSAIWLTPFLENDMYMSYHGYAATNLYKVDERFGSNELYKELVKSAKEKGIKVIYDHVANHIGINHKWVNNLPFETWINGKVGDHERANHDKPSIVDIHTNENARSFNEKGWFTNYMVDLNQANPFLAKYLIQNMLWWIEYTGLDGIREDTYPYANQKFMSDWAKAILDEYPNFNIVGEVWTGEPAFLAGFQKNSKVRENFETNLPSLLDFGLRDSFYRFLSGKAGVYDFYKTFAMDYLYRDIDNLMTFIDNHDIDRGMYTANGDVEKFKIALTILLTSRGIPQIFYGTEIGINEGDHHGKIRKPFPGGFTNDERNAFTKEGRTDLENEIYCFVKNLLKLRKEYKSLSSGKMIQYAPYDETYVYFTMKDDEKIMIVINNNDEEFEINLSRMKSEFGEAQTFKELQSGEMIAFNENGNLILPAKTARIYLLN